MSDTFKKLLKILLIVIIAILSLRLLVAIGYLIFSSIYLYLHVL